MRKDDLGDRMKSYENINRTYLIPNMPTIIRLDGKAFHSFTKGFKRPFDDVLIKTMNDTAKYLCENIMGCKIAYVQSDEITLLLTDYDTFQTQAWFGGNIQKIVSVSSSMATMQFNNIFLKNVMDKRIGIISEEYIENITVEQSYDKRFGTAMFDARVFQLPKEEVVNSFIWRQQDATRNSIQLVGQVYFSEKELHKVTCNMIQDKLMTEKNVNWNNFETGKKRGRCVIKENYLSDSDNGMTLRSRWFVDNDIPIFTQDRVYVEKYVYLESNGD